jgi:D-cysteine desulfhydrase
MVLTIKTVIFISHFERQKPYIIPMGGSNALGAWGYVEGFREIAEQYKIAAAEHGEGLATAPSDIVVASGSGGTVAGLCLGSFLSGPNSHTGHYTIIHSIAVCDNAEYFRSHVRDVFQQLNLPVEAVDQVLNSVDKYRGVAYAVSTDAELDIIASVARWCNPFLRVGFLLRVTSKVTCYYRATGIVTDPVYSG